MSFNGLEFLVFFGTFLLLFQRVRHHLIITQCLITLASFGFYVINEPEYFPHLLILSLINFAFAKAIHGQTNNRKLLLIVILAIDVAFLITTKIQGSQTQHFPMGISFFSFQIMSYVIDVYRNQTDLGKGLLHFHSYMFFFPHIVAGPICRANGLMKQMASKFNGATSEQIRSGFYLISAGLFKKVVLADTIAIRVNEIFGSHSSTQGIIAWSVVLVAFGWQIYFDFSGYTDMARGLAKLLGLEIPLNFSFPYFAQTLKDFWHRWHITLSEWFRDYVYIPIGGSKTNTSRYVMAILSTFILSGLWHGFGWNYIIWGLWHGLWLILFSQFLTKIGARIQRTITLFVVFFGWLFFRSQNITQIKEILHSMMINPFQSENLFSQYRELILLIIICVSFELVSHQFRLSYRKMNRAFSDFVWLALTISALIFQAPLKEFIYARF